MTRMAPPPPPPVIRIHGARTHNLRDLDLELPRLAWTVVCGVSGSGKSSLVLDTLGAESRRRFLGTLRQAGQAIEAVARPEVDRIEGLPPAVTAGFSTRRPGVRTTVGTITEVSHALRAIFMRAAVPHCPTCDAPVQAESREAIVAHLLALDEGTRVVLTAPRGRGTESLDAAAREGFVRVRIDDGEVVRIEDVDAQTLDPQARVAVVVDRLVVKAGAHDRFAASVDQALALGDGRLGAVVMPRGAPPRTQAWADRPHCAHCDTTWPLLTTGLFNFNSPAGACPTCEGRGTVAVLADEDILPPALRLSQLASRLGPSLPRGARAEIKRRVAALRDAEGLDRRATVAALPGRARTKLLAGPSRREPGLREMLERHGRQERLTHPETCPACAGSRLAPYPRAARLGDATLPALEALSHEELLPWLDALPLPEAVQALVEPARADAQARLVFLREVGLGYLTPSRAGASLSGGELRRARLAAACAARMSGLLYLLDEPTAGLHPADRPALARRMRALVDEGNTVICVEHDLDLLAQADHVLELGPGAGPKGGDIVFAGPPPRAQEAPAKPRARPRNPTAPQVTIEGATRRTLQGVTASFPTAGLTAVTGVSGAGKSTWALEVLTPVARAAVAGAAIPPDRARKASGLDAFDRVAVAGASAARHPRATPGSVLGILPLLRTLYASTLEARARGWAPSWFSTNVQGGGRCSVCGGTGARAVALRDLPAHRIPCDVCGGRRFRPEIERVRVKGYSMSDLLHLSIAEAASSFRDLPRVHRPLRAATDVGLGYLPLGEPTARLSGGEALRLRLAAALGRGGRSRTLYVLDEPCAGLHPTDVAHLVEVLLRLSADDNAVVAVEHHVDLIRQADHVIELGPGPGAAGGRIVFEGTPAALARSNAATARFL